MAARRLLAILAALLLAGPVAANEEFNRVPLEEFFYCYNFWQSGLGGGNTSGAWCDHNNHSFLSHGNIEKTCYQQHGKKFLVTKFGLSIAFNGPPNPINKDCDWYLEEDFTIKHNWTQILTGPDNSNVDPDNACAYAYDADAEGDLDEIGDSCVMVADANNSEQILLSSLGYLKVRGLWLTGTDDCTSGPTAADSITACIWGRYVEDDDL